MIDIMTSPFDIKRITRVCLPRRHVLGFLSTAKLLEIENVLTICRIM